MKLGGVFLAVTAVNTRWSIIMSVRLIMSNFTLECLLGYLGFRLGLLDIFSVLDRNEESPGVNRQTVEQYVNYDSIKIYST